MTRLIPTTQAQKEWAKTLEEPNGSMNKKVQELKLGVRQKHHWVRHHAKSFADVANQVIVHLQLGDGRA